jgi:hypothetical protein
MAKKTRAAASKDTAKEIIRVTFRFHGAELGQIREVRDMLSLNSEVDAARYLIQRGLEAMTATLTSRRLQGQMTQQVNPDEIIKKMMAMGFKMD